MALGHEARITLPVGRGGVNMRSDVVTIRQIINSRLPVPLRPLVVNGLCGPLTIEAIEHIQRLYLRMNPPDGRVDPHGATMRVLNGGSVRLQPPKPYPGGGSFPSDVIDAAKRSLKTWKIPASVTLAQWALESDWGRKMPIGSNNPFGIKACVEARTREVIHGETVFIVARFRKFGSMAEAFEQHARLLATSEIISQDC